jgi:thymidylate synthase ThyX
MGYSARILKDTVSSAGHRLTTFEVTFPRIVLAEFNTHRMFSRNSASSRAIPIKTMLKRVEEDPFVPTYWGKNQKGMQAAEELSPEAAAAAKKEWLYARDQAIISVKRLQMPDIDLHKQTANRLLEPWLWHTVIVTATEFQNFFGLRNNKMAQPEIATPAKMMRELFDKSTPETPYQGWHLPLVSDEDKAQASISTLVQLSCARCARVSYLTHDGKRDLAEDTGLYDRLRGPGHMSPLEHAAREMTAEELTLLNPWDGEPACGNFVGWVQHRKQLPGEAIFRP